MTSEKGKSTNEISPEQEGTVLRGILGGIARMLVCILALLSAAVFHAPLTAGSFCMTESLRRWQKLIPIMYCKKELPDLFPLNMQEMFEKL